jgi:hypothetical protein
VSVSRARGEGGRRRQITEDRLHSARLGAVRFSFLTLDTSAFREFSKRRNEHWLVATAVGPSFLLTYTAANPNVLTAQYAKDSGRWSALAIDFSAMPDAEDSYAFAPIIDFIDDSILNNTEARSNRSKRSTASLRSSRVQDQEEFRSVVVERLCESNDRSQERNN